MIKLHLRLLLKRLCLSLIAISPLPCAASISDAEIEWNGFLNIVGGSLQHEPKVDFSDERQHPGFQGYSEDFTFEPQSSGGIQAKKKLDAKTSVTMQLYAEGDVNGYDANLKWLYVTYKPANHSTLRIGRIGLPVYYYSDFLNVGYAYHWVAPPEATYPFDTTITAIDYVYQSHRGDWDWSMEFLAGSGEYYLPLIEAQVTNRNLTGMVFSFSRAEWFSVRAMLAHSTDTHEVDSLSSDRLLTQLETAIDEQLAEKGVTLPDTIRQTLIDESYTRFDNGILDLQDMSITYGDIAIRAETERWLLMTEWIKLNTNTYLYNSLITGFVTAGIHVNKALFHITAARAKNNPDDKLYDDLNAAPPTSALNLNENAEYIGAVFRTRIAGATYRNFESFTLGARYELSNNIAVKLDVTNFRDKASFEGDTYGVGRNMLFRTALNAIF